MDNQEIAQKIDLLTRMFSTFAQQAGYEFDAEGNATRVRKVATVPAIIEKSKKFNFKQALIDSGACPNESQLFMDARAKKKAVNSEQAYKMFTGGLGRYTVAQAVTLCADNQWKGFKVEWAENLQPEQKKRYSFMELAAGDHVQPIIDKYQQPQIAAPANAIDEFALAYQQHGIKRLS